MFKAARWTVVSLLVTSVLILAFAVGYVLRGDGDTTTVARPDANDSAGEQDFSNLNEILDLLDERYVDPDRIDRETLYLSAVNGMLETLSDSGTFYVDPETFELRIGASGTFDGIGATVSEEEGRIVIVAPIEDTPAERAGIRAGDIVLEVDGESTEGWSQEQAVLRIRGPRGTTVTLLIRHDDDTEETFEIERDEIKVESVTTVPPGGTLEDGSGTAISDVAYIHIREFTGQTEQEVREALSEAIEAGATGIILDLRNNPGGLLSVTANVADEFLDSGVILSERERDGSEKAFQARRGGEATDIPVVIILNRFSASGSEVLAAALHDNDRATIVGEKSFGKGTVNEQHELNDGGAVYVSIAKWLTPDGTQIDGVGIRPDIEILLSDEDIDLRRDVQLFKAIDVLRGTDTTPVTTLPAPTLAAEATPGEGG
jgi:carboxyl-terminal processing protease